MLQTSVPTRLRAPPAGADTEVLRAADMPMRVLRITGASWLFDAMLLALFVHAAGVAAEGALEVVALGGTLVCAAFALLFARRPVGPGRDRYRSVPQLVASSAVVLVAAWASPAASGLLLTTLFLVFAFAALRMNPAQIATCWALVTAGVVLLVVGAGVPLAIPTATPLQAALSATWLSAVVGRCALLGLYGETVRRRLAKRGRALADATGRLEQLAMVDALTGALNRRAIMGTLDDALRGAPDAGRGVAVALVDLDHFKAINDRFGHPVGDEVLSRFVACASRALRPTDRIGRYGGEEFLVVLPAVTDPASARRVAERLRRGLDDEPWGALAHGLSVTVSIGVAFARPAIGSGELLSRADRSLYRAKRAGRDRVVLDGEPDAAVGPAGAGGGAGER